MLLLESNLPFSLPGGIQTHIANRSKACGLISLETAGIHECKVPNPRGSSAVGALENSSVQR
jgi:hypothetical protein